MVTVLCDGWSVMWVGNLKAASCIPKSVWSWEPCAELVRDWDTLGFAAAGASSSFSLCIVGVGSAEPAAGTGQHGKFGLRRLCWLLPSDSRDLNYGAAPCQHSPAANHGACPCHEGWQRSCPGLRSWGLSTQGILSLVPVLWW